MKIIENLSFEKFKFKDYEPLKIQIMKAHLTLLVAVMLLATFSVQAQVESNIQHALSINQDGSAADSSALLDVSSDSLGVLISRMSSASRNAISNPAVGLLVYDTDLNAPCHYTGSGWLCLLPPPCQTLDMAYDCGGPGLGRTITVDTGAVLLSGSNPSTSTLEVSAASVLTTSRFDQFGFGEAVFAHQLNPGSIANTLTAINDGLGRAGEFVTSNPASTARTLEAAHMGPGTAGFFETLFPADTNRTIQGHQHGLGTAGYFQSHNTGNIKPTVEALNEGLSDGVHGIATDTVFDVAGVKGTGKGDAYTAAALEAHDGAIRVSKTTSPNTPAEKITLNLTSWLPMDDCPSACGGPGIGGDTQAWNSDIITIANVYVDPARSVIIHSVEHPFPNIGIKAITKGLVPGGFMVQFVSDTDMCPSGIGCGPPSGPVTLHYLIVNL